MVKSVYYIDTKETKQNSISIMVRLLSHQNHRFSLEILSSPLRVKCLFGTVLRALIIIKVAFCLEIFLTLLLFWNLIVIIVGA